MHRQFFAYFFIFGALWFTVEAKAQSDACKFSLSPVVIFKTKKVLSEVWVTPDSKILWSDILPNDKIYREYNAWVLSKVNPDPIAILRNQKSLYEQSAFSKEVKSFELVLNHKVGHIDDINCLEALLFTEHLKFHSFQTQTEFSAFVLRLTRSENQTDLKVYFCSSSDDGMATTEDEIFRVIEEDLGRGWILVAQLHNHPFMFDNPSGDIAGSTIPSDGDIRTYQWWKKNIKMENAWITNGISTIHLKSDEIDQFPQD